MTSWPRRRRRQAVVRPMRPQPTMSVLIMDDQRSGGGSKTRCLGVLSSAPDFGRHPPSVVGLQSWTLVHGANMPQCITGYWCYGLDLGGCMMVGDCYAAGNVAVKGPENGDR